MVPSSRASVILACALGLLGCALSPLDDDIPPADPSLSTVDPNPEPEDEPYPDPTHDGVPGEVLDSQRIADLPELYPTRVTSALPAPEPVTDGVGFDFVEPPPTLQIDWAEEVERAPTLDRLDFLVTNRSDEPVRLGLTAVTDGGTTRGAMTALARLEIPAGSTATFRVPTSTIPRPAQRALPGLLQVAVEDGGARTAVLPELFLAWSEVAGQWTLLTETQREEATGLGHGAAAGRTVQWVGDDPDDVALPTVDDVDALGDVAAATHALTASEYRTCVRWQARTTDSGNGEDRLSWANGSTSLVTAYGVRIRISQGTWSRTLDTSPTSGCVTWSTSRNGPFTVRVYHYVRDTNANLIRYHDGGDITFGSYPATTYWFDVTGYSPPRGQTSNVSAGSWTTRATAMAVASMVSRYYAGYASSSQIHVGDDFNNSDNGSSAHYCTSNCNYANQDAYVRLTSSNRRLKFVVAHELGHARAIVRQGRLEPNYDDDLSSGGCNDGDSYSMLSREWNMIGMREGYAHYVAARVFNDTSSSYGTFTWFEGPYGLEGPAASGGYIGSTCGGATDGQSVNLDVLRTLWDWDTPDSLSDRAERRDISDTYLRMVNSSPGRSEYYSEFSDAALIEASTAEWNTLHFAAAHNGLYD